MTRLLPPAALAAVVLAASGCGGGGGTPKDNRPQVGGQLIGGVINCLTDENWLVQPGEVNQVIGTSDLGVTFRVTFYPTVEAAKKKAGKHAVISNGVVEFNVPGIQTTGGGQQNVKPTTEAATIKKCIDHASS
jgi:hypothetical protein